MSLTSNLAPEKAGLAPQEERPSAPISVAAACPEANLQAMPRHSPGAIREAAQLASGRPGHPLGWLAGEENTQKWDIRNSWGLATGKGATPTLLISLCRSLVTISSKTSPSPLMSLGWEGVHQQGTG